VVQPPADPALVLEAVSLARQGAARALSAFRKGGLETDRKVDGSLVTATDRAVEAFLRERIRELHPEDAVLGEEHGALPGTSGRRWILDPIDGTEAFVHGVAEFSTLLAVEDERGPLVGVIVVPALGETTWGARGRGAFCDGVVIRVSDTAALRGAVVATSDLEDWPGGALSAAREAGVRLRTWGGGYGMALALSGRVDAFVDYDVDVWDLAPAAAIAPEAGGRFGALDGSTRADLGSGLVSNDRLHEDLLSVLAGGDG
jgi:histidinol-phosphatase